MQSIAERGGRPSLAWQRMFTCMRRYKGPNTSKKHPQHRIYPYLLRKLAIKYPSHTCKHVLPVKGCGDITYIPVKNGFFVFGGDYGLGDLQSFDHCPAVHVYVHERGDGFPIRSPLDDCSNHLPVKGCQRLC